jgi:hypothetical protein
MGSDIQIWGAERMNFGSVGARLDPFAQKKRLNPTITGTYIGSRAEKPKLPRLIKAYY